MLLINKTSILPKFIKHLLIQTANFNLNFIELLDISDANATRAVNNFMRFKNSC